jgi:hypothetical protein
VSLSQISGLCSSSVSFGGLGAEASELYIEELLDYGPLQPSLLLLALSLPLREMEGSSGPFFGRHSTFLGQVWRMIVFESMVRLTCQQRHRDHKYVDLNRRRTIFLVEALIRF